ncbi:cupin domain-containing protein [Limosilactobacillus gastricus]|uniref:cupin domain-containing protein n=1 Tax=Limosilactobacillus gastricus TaxID=227942 RepID=UPI0026ED9EAD|nr:cupin domain-containing protein [Limosilactobacillus gastricus]
MADLVPYQADKIINMDLIQSDQLKFVVMSFDQGTGLAEHAAPGDAIIFALDGQGIITYEGQNHQIQAGQNFHFAQGGRHSVQGSIPFKMALLIDLTA